MTILCKGAFDQLPKYLRFLEENTPWGGPAPRARRSPRLHQDARRPVQLSKDHCRAHLTVADKWGHLFWLYPVQGHSFDAVNGRIPASKKPWSYEFNHGFHGDWQGLFALRNVAFGG